MSQFQLKNYFEKIENFKFNCSPSVLAKIQLSSNQFKNEPISVKKLFWENRKIQLKPICQLAKIKQLKSNKEYKEKFN
jgi:hypothetical protein